MTFQVTYRNKDGKPTAEYFEAESREAMFAVLSKRGISAIKVESAKSRPRSPKQRASVSRVICARTIASLVMVLLLVGLGLCLVKRLDSADKGGNTTKQKRSAKISLPTPTPVVSANQITKPDIKPDDKPEKSEPPPYVKRPGQMQLPSGKVLTFQPPKEGEFRIVHSHGSTYKCDHLGNWEDVTPKPVFDNSFEESLVGLATTGDFIPGMLMGIAHDDAIKMLTKPVVINDDDSEDVVAKKRAVAEAKEAILDYMKDGASLDDFVMDMRKQVARDRYVNGIALKEIVTLLKEGRKEEAGEVREAAERMLEGPMKLPAHIDDALEN